MKIEHFQKIDKPGSSLKASFNVVIPEWDFTINITYFEKEDGRKWFGYPSREYKNEAGDRKYQWLAYFGEKGKARFEDALKVQLTKFLPENDSEENLPF